MKYVLIAITLLLGACDGPPAQVPKIAAPQREALEKAKAVDQTVQDAAAASKQKAEEVDQ